MTDVLESAGGVLKQNKMACSFHNHAVEFQAQDGVKPIDILAQSKDLLFHIDVNVGHRAGGDPVAFIKQYSHRTNACCSPTAPPTQTGTRR